MTAQYSWYEFYKTALLETDWTKMPERIQAAESEIKKRQNVLSAGHSETAEERHAITDATRGLQSLRMNAASWLERQRNLGGTSPDSDSQTV